MTTWLNLGCGGNILPPPWRNHDSDVDITKPLPFRDGVVGRILIEHCLEHVSGPDGFRFLCEAHRIMEPLAVLRICVPELRRLPVPEKRDIILNHGHLMVYCPENLKEMLEAAGFNPDDIKMDLRNDSIDGHWKIIGKEKDDRETLRMEAIKT